MPEPTPTADDVRREPHRALNLVMDSDWRATCSRLRVILEAGAGPYAEEPILRSSDTTSVPRWHAAAATAVRDWYREHLIPIALEHAERGLKGAHYHRTRDADSWPRDGWGESLENAAATALAALARDALDGIPWAAWLEDVDELVPREGSDDGHPWLGAALTIWPILSTTNPDEPAGEWSTWALARATFGETADDDALARVSAALAGLAYHDLVGTRFVGGTSGTLFSLLPDRSRLEDRR